MKQQQARSCASPALSGNLTPRYSVLTTCDISILKASVTVPMRAQITAFLEANMLEEHFVNDFRQSCGTK